VTAPVSAIRCGRSREHRAAVEQLGQVQQGQPVHHDFLEKRQSDISGRLRLRERRPDTADLATLNANVTELSARHRDLSRWPAPRWPGPAGVQIVMARPMRLHDGRRSRSHRAASDEIAASVPLSFTSQPGLDELAANVLFRRRLHQQGERCQHQEGGHSAARGTRADDASTAARAGRVFCVDPPVALGPVTPPAPAPPSFDVPPVTGHAARSLARATCGDDATGCCCAAGSPGRRLPPVSITPPGASVSPPSASRRHRCCRRPPCCRR